MDSRVRGNDEPECTLTSCQSVKVFVCKRREER